MNDQSFERNLTEGIRRVAAERFGKATAEAGQEAVAKPATSSDGASSEQRGSNNPTGPERDGLASDWAELDRSPDADAANSRDQHVARETTTDPAARPLPGNVPREGAAAREEHAAADRDAARADRNESAYDRARAKRHSPGSHDPGADDWNELPASGGGGDIGRGRGESMPVPRGPSQQPVPRRDMLPDNYGPPSAYNDPIVEEGRLDLRKYLWLAFKHRWLILGAAGVFVILGLIATLLTTPIYRADATIQINRDADTVVEFEGMKSPDAGRDVEFYQTQYELLKSRSLAERVVKDLSLENNDTFMNAAAPSAWSQLRNMIFGGGSAAPTLDVSARQAIATGRVLDNLSVQPVRSSSIVKLSFDSPSPETAQRVVNAVAQTFITVNLERRYESSAYARKFLEERLEQLKVKLAESEKELVAYAEREKIVGTGETQTLSATNLGSANTALSKATAERLKKEQVWQQVQSATGLAMPQIMQSEAIETMRAKQVELSAEYQDKLSFFKPAFPEMRQIRAQIDELDRQIAAEVELIKQSAKAEYDAAVAEERSLAKLVEDLKAEVTDFRNRNIQYTILQREVDTNRSLYEGLLQRYKEIGVAGGVGVNNVSIVDASEIPDRPFTPRLGRNLAIALMLGLMMGGAAAFAREHLDDTIKSPEDVEENLGVPLLGIIPMVGALESSKALFDDPRSPAAEAYRSLRTALQFSTSGGVPKILLITSSRASEGKSTTAVTLSRNFAQLGLRVLLIDGDLRKPSQHRHLGLDQSVGLSNFLAGNGMPPEALQRTDMPGLTAMTSGPLPPNPAELLAGAKMVSLLTIAAQKYDLVVIDAPPVAGLADAPLLSSLASGTLLVIDAKGTRRGVAKAALKRLSFARAQIIGAVINKLDLATTGYSYGYGYGYGYGDTNYYGETPSAQLTHKKKSEA
jgi:succinoglycan biosynthesis transport protein ExoP